ncbi:MAG: hypothetical protein ABEJ06_05370 [Haloarculaceae archaeon]
MTDDDAEAAAREFIDDARRALAEYEKGYTDADATLRVLRKHVDDLEDRLAE